MHARQYNIQHNSKVSNGELLKNKLYCILLLSLKYTYSRYQNVLCSVSE